MFEFIEDESLREQAEGILKSQIEEVKGDLKTQIETAVAEATSGLKANHDKLLDEKKKLQETYKGITDPEEALKALELINENEEMQLLKDGKFEEVVEKRLSEKTGDFEAKLEELSSKNTEAVERADKYQTLFETKVIEDTLRTAAGASKVLEYAIKDALLQGKAVFSISEDGTVEARDSKGKLIKTEDGKILTPTLWIEEQKKSSPHWWPASAGGDLNPGEDYESLDAQMRRAADSGDTKKYRELKAKKKKLTGE